MHLVDLCVCARGLIQICKHKLLLQCRRGAKRLTQYIVCMAQDLHDRVCAAHLGTGGSSRG